MDIEKLINRTEFTPMLEQLDELKKKQEENSFNIFSTVCKYSHYENFHSDIIRRLLDPNELHNESNLFLMLFIDYINSFEGVRLEKEDYLNGTEIIRETGRIDIWIKNNVSRKAIIIENKINNAPDMPDQLQRYHDYCKENDFEVDCIIYLTLCDGKSAPLTHCNDINNKFLDINAFTDSPSDLSNGWLKECYNRTTNIDNQSFIHQYIKLLEHLSKKGMDRNIKNTFYDIINERNGFEVANCINKLTSSISEYRADLFMEGVGDFQPFAKKYRWRTNHWLFENYKLDDIVFKLDVIFNEDGNIVIHFWNPGNSHDIQHENTSKRLQEIGLLADFQSNGFGGGMFKLFSKTETNNLKDVDAEALEYIKTLFSKLKE